MMKTNSIKAINKQKKVKENGETKSQKKSQKEKEKQIQAIKNNNNQDFDNIDIIMKYVKRSKTEDNTSYKRYVSK